MRKKIQAQLVERSWRFWYFFNSVLFRGHSICIFSLAVPVLPNKSNSTSTSIPTTTTTTTNNCMSAYTYSTQLLYLNMNSNMSWTLYQFNYTSPANVTSVTLMFSFRSDPAYWYVDDVSVTDSFGQELLSNGDFEQGTFGRWVYCNPSNASHSGYISYSNVSDGFYYYCDGSVGTFDYLSQQFNVQPNKVYNVQFWLALDSSHATVNATYASISIVY